jgi:hypothetical protein
LVGGLRSGANAWSSRRPFFLDRGILTCFFTAWPAGRYHPFRSCLAAFWNLNERPVKGLMADFVGTARGLLDPFFGTRVEEVWGRTEACTRLACDSSVLMTCAMPSHPPSHQPANRIGKSRVNCESHCRMQRWCTHAQARCTERRHTCLLECIWLSCGLDGLRMAGVYA